MLVIFLLSNRGSEDLSFWPFGFLATLPIGAVMIAVLVIGFLGGLAAHIPKRYGARRRLKKAEKRIAELEARLAAQAPSPGVTTGSSPTPLLTSGRQTTIVR